MQILVGVLGGIVIVWLFFRGFAELGIRLSGLNPALRRRRAEYQMQCRNPVYNIESPLEMTALLLVAAGNNRGELNAEARREILRLFQDTFHLNKKDACTLLISSAWLLRDGAELRNNLRQVMQRSLRNFTRAQKASALAMVEGVASLHTGNPIAEELVAKTRELLSH